MVKTLLGLSSLLLCAATLQAQEIELSELDKQPRLKIDTNYIKSYRDDLTARFFTSYKYTTFTLPANDGNNATFNGIAFRPNTTFNTGIGLTHKGFTFNLGTGLPGINGKGEKRGITKKIDFQMHMYMRAHIVDLYLQRYQGYYFNKGRVTDHEGYYSDENLKVRQFGFSYHYVFNNKKFTFRNANLHDERQLKSAGSLLAGMDFQYFQVKNDSTTIIPLSLNPEFAYMANISKFHTYNFGPSIGYAYNFVFGKHFFLLPALSVSGHVNVYQDRTNGTKVSQHVGFVPAANARVGIGYNDDKWAFTFYAIHQVSTFELDSNLGLGSIHTGNYRFNIVKRFQPGKTAKKILTPWYWIFK